MGKGWLRMVGVVVAAVTATAAVAADVLPMAQFRERVAERIRADHPAVRVTLVGEDQLRIEFPGGQVMTSSLQRGYLLYQDDPTALPDVLKGFSGSVRARRVPATLESVVILVRPLPQAMTQTNLARPIAGGMWAVVAQNLPDSFEFPSRDELRSELKLDDQAIWRRALQNTRKRVGIAPHPLKLDGPVEISTGGYFASSLLADDEFWNAPQILSAGPIVVFALARDHLYVAPLKATEVVARMRAAIAGVKDDPNGLTNSLIVRRDGHWETLP